MKADFYLLIHLSPLCDNLDFTWSLSPLNPLSRVHSFGFNIPVSQFQLHLYLHLHLQPPFVILNLILHHFTIPKPHFLRSHHVL